MLLTLALELRDEIYGYLLAGEPVTSNKDAFIRRIFHTGILGVSKQIHLEAQKFLLQKHSFILLHYEGNQKSFDHKDFAPFLRCRIPIVSRGLQTTKPSPCTRLQLGLTLKCVEPSFGDADKEVQNQHALYSFLICSSDFELVSRMAQWSCPWTKLDAIYVTSTAPATLWTREAGQNSRMWSRRHALMCTDVSFCDRSLHHVSETSRQELITNTYRFICTSDGPTTSGLESAERVVMERRMTPTVLVLTKVMADLLKTAQYLKARADHLLAEGREGRQAAKCLYAAFLQGYHRSTRPFLMRIKAEMLRQDPNCVEYIYRITELAYNVQISHIRADPYAAPTVKAIEVLQDFHELFSDKLEHMLPQAHGRIKSTLVNGMHLELLLTGAENLVESLEKLLEICPGDEHLLHDLNVAKKLQARAHVSHHSKRLKASLTDFRMRKTTRLRQRNLK